MRTIRIFDTTLRDGEQAPGCSMQLEEKIEIAKALERLKVDVIEAGFAVISPGDFESVKTIAQVIKGCEVASLARAVKKDIDAAYEAVKYAAAPKIHTFIATSPVHMQYKLQMTPERVLEVISEMVSYAKKYVNAVEFSAEDAMRSEPEFLAKAVTAAIAAGATVVNIPDTVGYATPAEMAQTIQYLKNNVKNIDNAEISVHCHNDLGMAVANSLAAVTAGATQVECTINGLGERAGNAALEEVVMGLDTRKALYGGSSRVDTSQIYKTSMLVYNILGFQPPVNKAIVGANAFAHEAGIHQHGVMANRLTYEIMTPQSIGLPTNRMVLGKHSGRHAVESRLIELGYTLSKEELDTVFESFKALSDKKKVITDRDLEALLKHRSIEISSGYKLVNFTVNSGNYVTSNAVVKLTDGKNNFEEVAIGDGPIDAAYKAIDKIIKGATRSLENYSIHSISEGKDALGEAVVKVKCGEEFVTGRGLSTDVIEASVLAYINALNKLQITAEN
jgi:2-isopropylmalate synthase